MDGWMNGWMDGWMDHCSRASLAAAAASLSGWCSCSVILLSGSLSVVVDRLGHGFALIS